MRALEDFWAELAVWSGTKGTDGWNVGVGFFKIEIGVFIIVAMACAFVSLKSPLSLIVPMLPVGEGLLNEDDVDFRTLFLS
jgi:hypothetical protein